MDALLKQPLPKRTISSSCVIESSRSIIYNKMKILNKSEFKFITTKTRSKQKSDAGLIENKELEEQLSPEASPKSRRDTEVPKGVKRCYLGRRIQLSGKLTKKQCSLADEPQKMMTFLLEEEGEEEVNKGGKGMKKNLALKFRTDNDEDMSCSSNFSPNKDREELLELLKQKKAKLGELKKRKKMKEEGKRVRKESKFKLKKRMYSTGKIRSNKPKVEMVNFNKTEMTPQKSILKKTCSLFKMKSRRKFSIKNCPYNQPPDKKVTFNRELRVFRFREKTSNAIGDNDFRPDYFKPKYHRKSKTISDPDGG